MKKLLYIVFFLFPLSYFLNPSIEAATPKGVDSIYVYDQDSALIFMQEWLYDENGTKTNEVQYTWVDGVKRGDINTFQAYDAQNNLAEDVVLKWDAASQQWLGDSRTEKLFNASKKDTLGVHYQWTDGWVLDSVWTCEYNAQGKPVQTIYQSRHNGPWLEQYKLIQDYQGSYETYHEEYLGRNEHGLIGKTKWSKLYNGSMVISDRQYQWSGTAFVPTSWDTTGIKNGKTTLKESYVWTGGVQTGKTKEEWEFNGDGWQTLHITYSGWENGAFVPKEKQVDEWSGSTNTMTAKYTWNKTAKAWEGTTKTENLTINGYAIKKTYKGWANNDFVPETIDSTKNENGKKVYYAKWTYSGGVWKGSSREVYAYEGSYQTLQEKYNSWNNGWIGSNGNKWVQIWKGGKVWSKVTYDWSSGWVPNVKDSTEYSGDDVTFSVHYKWTGSAWEGDNTKSNYSQTYISPGQKDWTITLKWENNQWNNYIQTKSTYSGGKLVEERSQQWNGSAWQDVKVVYHTWENGVEVFTRTEEWNNDAQKLKMTKQAKCDIVMEGNKKVEEAYYECLADSVWYGVKPWRTTWETYTTDTTSVDAQITYSWDKKSTDWVNKTKNETITGINDLKDLYSATASYSWSSDEGWVLGSSHEKWVDYKNRTIKEKQSKCEYGFCHDEYVYENAYDDEGRQTLSSQLNGSTGNRTENTYDENGNKTLIRYSSWNDALGDWLATSEEIYQYDDQHRKIDFEKTTQEAGTGNLIKSQKEKCFYNGSEKTPYSTLQYEYVIPEGQETGEWVVKQEDTYKYDNNDSSDKLREEIHGTWSKGVVIKYERTVYFYHDDPK